MWEDLYEKHYPELKRYAAGICRNEAEAEDLAQEAFLKALQNAHVLEDLGPSQRRAWLFRTMKNEFCDRYRRSRLEDSFLTAHREGSYQEPGLQMVENQLLLSLLSPQDRALFHLRYEEGYTAAELAEMFALPAGTVRSRLSRCRTLLKNILNHGGFENG